MRTPTAGRLAGPVAVIAFLALAGAAVGSASDNGAKRHIRQAFTDFRSGLRHENGERACGRMTLRYRRELLSGAAEGGVAGLGCVRVIESVGRELYNTIISRTLTEITMRGDHRARAYTNANSTICFRREHGRWRLDDAAETRKPRLC